MQVKARRLAQRLQVPVGAAQGFGGAGPIQHQAIRQQQKEHVDGRARKARCVNGCARAYAAETGCRQQPHASRLQLDAVLAELQLAMPEGGSLVRHIQGLRNRCR